ncbi:MAG: EamA family transporter RarD [Colwellia sp.]
MNSNTKVQNESTMNKSGVFNALGAYVMWGIAPLYFKLLQEISAGEILMHRVIWSSIFLVLLIVAVKKWPLFISYLKQPRILIGLVVTAIILALNWFIFIWAINNDKLLEASLGYYINPLLNVALGMMFFQERLRNMQIFAVFLAIAGVFIQLFTLGTLPVVSLALAGTFGVYGMLKKKMHVDSLVALFIESLLMLPIALIYWFAFIDSSTSNLVMNSTHLNIILILSGVVTTAPLLCFTAAAKRLTLSTLGFFQYIGPSIMFLLAAFYYHEELKAEQLMTFAFIWLALIIYSFDSFQNKRKEKREAVAVTR